MAMAKSEGNTVRGEVQEVVADVCNGNLGVLGAVAVRVANKRTLVISVELGVGDGDPGNAVGDIKETIIASIYRLIRIH